MSFAQQIAQFPILDREVIISSYAVIHDNCNNYGLGWFPIISMYIAVVVTGSKERERGGNSRMWSSLNFVSSV